VTLTYAMPMRAIKVKTVRNRTLTLIEREDDTIS
jgi:hypothetical protein